MRKKDVYEIATKLLGIYIAIVALNQFKDFWVLLFFTSELNSIFTDDQMILFSGLAVIGTFVIAYLLLFKTPKVVRLITQPSDEETVNIHLDKKEIYQICLILAGILMIVFSLSQFIDLLKSLFFTLNTSVWLNNIQVLFPVIKMVLGALLVKFSVPIANYINEKIK